MQQLHTSPPHPRPLSPGGERGESTVSKRLNVGCGTRFHREWINLDLRPVDASVRRWDVTQALPFDDGVLDVVYHSHLLEHLPSGEALEFLRECWRVLMPGGIMRLAIPDLEGIARLYLQAVDQAWSGDAEALERHRWLVMELYDQASREQSGGAMLPHLRGDGNKSSLAWFRIGQDGTVIRRHLQQMPASCPSTFQQRFLARLKGWLFGSWRERLIRRLLGQEYPLLQIGRFRRGGEIHHWMYDRVALRELLTQAGFVGFRCVGANESAIPDWWEYHLDTTPDGAVCKPDSLFVEAAKP